LGESLMFQPVRVKLEVHPKGGATYVAYDRFNARPRELYQLNPGVELPVTIASFNPQWVASHPEALAEAHQQVVNAHLRARQGAVLFPGGMTADPKLELAKLKEMQDAKLITQQDYDKKKAEILAKM